VERLRRPLRFGAAGYEEIGSIDDDPGRHDTA
jgi:hypothetical protein